MIVRRSNTENELDTAALAWFDSDAPSNAEAVREIDAEAARHGLVRTREYWLQTFSMPDGRVVFRGFCYRPERSDAPDRIARRRGTEVVGASSAELVRVDRDGG